jgi:phosphatidylethanolamine/phosphatidyl-N-methylethanolamine N-methyltransferase
MNKQTAAFYNNLSFLYPLVDMFLKSQKRRLFNELANLPAGKVLEIGIGNGAHLHHYKKHEVIGIDTSAAMLETARKKLLRNVSVMEMDGQALLFDDQVFDYVVLSHVIAVVENKEQLLQEVHRVLKPQGKLFILNHFTPDNWIRHIDFAFQYIGRLLHFRSFFRLQDLRTEQKFNLQKEVNLGMVSYFKLLIYGKR